MVGRYVYFYLGRNRILSLCEVQVLGKVVDRPPPPVNFARSCPQELFPNQWFANAACPTQQSSTEEKHGFAKNANDHSGFSGNYDLSECTHTLPESGGAWWMVDMRKQVMVEYLVVTGRDSWAERTEDYSIYVTNAESINDIDHEQDTCVKLQPHLPAGKPHKITCMRPIVGSKVWFFLPPRLNGPRILTLCEVQVYGEMEPNLARSCDHGGRKLFAQECHAFQSSSYEDGHARKAISHVGFNGRSECSHTGVDRKDGARPGKGAWWGVEIPNSAVTGLTIVGRSDCCEERMDGFEVYVGYYDSNEIKSNAVCATNQKYPKAGQFKYVGCRFNSKNVKSKIGVEGDYVFIYLPSATDRDIRVLSLCEVMVWGVSQERAPPSPVAMLVTYDSRCVSSEMECGILVCQVHNTFVLG